jgi:transcriptional regulator with XRE-family HTH domain
MTRQRLLSSDGCSAVIREREARTIGRRLRQIRNSRGKSLVVVTGLAGINKSHLQRIETGQRALDSRSETVALANALGISPSELTRLPVPAPANGDNDAAVGGGESGTDNGHRKRPRGQVVPVDVLRLRVRTLARRRAPMPTNRRRCRAACTDSGFAHLDPRWPAANRHRAVSGTPHPQRLVSPSRFDGQRDIRSTHRIQPHRANSGNTVRNFWRFLHIGISPVVGRSGS